MEHIVHADHIAFMVLYRHFINLSLITGKYVFVGTSPSLVKLYSRYLMHAEEGFRRTKPTLETDRKKKEKVAVSEIEPAIDRL